MAQRMSAVGARGAGAGGAEGPRKTFVKIVVVGDAGVGKTCLLHQHVNNRYTESYKPTIGADFHTHEVEMDGVLVTVQFWDTAGQERFHSLGVAFYRGADAVIMVFDKQQPRTFKQLDYWRSEFLAQASPPDEASFPIVVCGNKCDAKDVAVTKTMARKWCDARGAAYFDTSAKDNINVDDAFLRATRMAAQRRAATGNTEFDFSQGTVDLKGALDDEEEAGDDKKGDSGCC